MTMVAFMYNSRLQIRHAGNLLMRLNSLYMGMLGNVISWPDRYRIVASSMLWYRFFNAKAGTLAYIPARCIHSIRVDSREARLLNFYLPVGFERAITEFGVPAKSRVLPPAELKQPGTAEQMICSIG